ncbi:conserved hypothetical protein 103, partial [candidate division TM7 genomosp. GTL1]
MFNQAKMVMKLKKAQKELAKEVVEVAAGDGAVTVQVTGELKLKKVKLNPELIDFDDIEELERWIEVAVRDAMSRA